jgi:MoaA/NifB/PqqE/SkfB family radical SAM enzyme
VGRRAVELGFTSTVGIIHDGDGQLQPLKPEEQDVYLQMKEMGKKSYAKLNFFQDNIAYGRENKWKCRAGARYLYVCEDGLVHYCSQQRGYPAIPLKDYTLEDIRREFITEKGCAPRCTVACVHYTSYMDFWRAPQTIPSPAAASEPKSPFVQIARR